MKIITPAIKLCLILVFSSLTNYLFADSQKIIISEFMALNSNNIVDEDNEHSDWIEIYNASDSTINLSGWSLTDKSDDLKEWLFPQIEISKGAYMVIFASGKNRVDPIKNLHTNFKLSGSGEFLAICEPDATISFSYNPTFPTQRQDVSYGMYQGQQVYFATATPGTENVGGNLPFAPNFSTTRGFFKTAFDVTLSSPEGNGSIYYTTNGTRPKSSTGTLYTAPIHITTTTTLSAVAVNSTGMASEVITNNYIFPEDVVNQSASPVGYPTDWKQAASSVSLKADYEMDPDICNSTAYKSQMENALKSIPTMSIVTDVSNIFSNVNDATTGGIYIYTGLPTTTGVNWARPASIEYYDPITGKEFQLNCRLKLHGGNSRNPVNTYKHGFELGFKSTYGPSKLNFELYDDKNVSNEFNSLILRASYNYSWVHVNSADQRVNAQYLQDPWAKKTQLDMGQPSGHERWVNLYLNGLFWGLYNVAEDYSDDFMASYLGGDKEQYDIIKEKQYSSTTYTTATPTAGNFLAWNDFVNQVQTNNIATNANYQKIQGKNADGTVNSTYSKLLDADNYIDYVLVNYYMGNQDWDSNNWCSARNRVANDTGFRFFCWDAETTMTSIGTNIVKNTMTANNPSNFMQYLVKNPDFKVELADRIQKHCISAGGALTPTAVVARYTTLANEIELPIIGESARWGDCTGTLYKKNDNWTPRKNTLLNKYFPFRTDTLVKQLRNAGFFPSVKAPVFTNNGGTISSAINLGMTTNSGTIYYTIDGTDPRTSITGTVSTSAKTYANAFSVGSSIAVKARAKTSTEWSPITEATFVYTNPNAIQIPLAELLTCSNYPNPFGESTRIRMTLPTEGDLQLDIYGVDGRLVKQLFKGKAFSGANQFDWTPETTQTGIYICHITYSGQSTYLKLMKK